jgi:hypothetical protein
MHSNPINIYNQMRSDIYIVMCLLFAMIQLQLQAQNGTEKKNYTTQRLVGAAPVIDGTIDDDAWKQGTWEGGFVQYEPYENADPSFDTRFKILYDDNNLYIAFKAYDPAPDSIVRRLSRRDDAQGDFMAIQFDSYFDQRTGFAFFVTAAGVKADCIYLNDGESQDYTWDPVWYVKTSITDFGWVAEMQIPLNQLRFGNQEEHVWGLQAGRQIFRKQELSFWQPMPRNASGWVRFIGEMHGITGIHPKKQVAVTPYMVAQMERFEKQDGNPFRTGRDQGLNAGLDAKIGLTNDLTLDLSVNPDFGQVEADPSVVNLTAVETFYDEKRPFFIEGRNIMNYRLQPGNGSEANENIFYSRRIGRRPQFYPDVNDNEYIKSPSNTSILGAAKLTGKTRNGLSIGIMESFTAREHAVVDSEGVNRRYEVEPSTNYFAARVAKDYDRGNTVVGGMFTAVNRELNNPDLLFLHRAAYTGGLDLEHNWKDKTYTFRIKLLGSYVCGDSTALIRTQRSSARYFHRPDAEHFSLDSTRTSLSGHGGAIEFWKGGSAKLRYGGFVMWKSPGLELNDIGYLRSSDEVFQVFWAGYNVNEPNGIYQRWSLNLNQWTGWNFSGANIFKGGNINGYIQFKNYWSFSSGVNGQGNSLAKSALRGGPLLTVPGMISNWSNINSDSRRSLRIGLGWFVAKHFDSHGNAQNFYANLTYRPDPAISLTLSPSYSANHNNLQFVSNIETDAGMRYINATLDQKTLSLALRANFNITPDLTIQYWGRPFISTGKYTDFKYIANSRADVYADRFNLLTAQQIKYSKEDEIYRVDQNLDGITDYTFDNPDYKALFFQSNLVLRWEYLPGSTLFLVWSQGRNDYFIDGGFSFMDDTRDLYRIHPHNVFLIKISYRLGIS